MPGTAGRLDQFSLNWQTSLLPLSSGPPLKSACCPDGGTTSSLWWCSQALGVVLWTPWRVAPGPLLSPLGASLARARQYPWESHPEATHLSGQRGASSFLMGTSPGALAWPCYGQSHVAPLVPSLRRPHVASRLTFWNLPSTGVSLLRLWFPSNFTCHSKGPEAPGQLPCWELTAQRGSDLPPALEAWVDWGGPDG